jgi:hypothetical protein
MNSATPSIPKNDQKDIQNLVNMVEEYQNFEVATVNDCQEAANILGRAKTRFSDLEARRKEITKPLDDAKKSVMDLFRPATDALASLERIMKPKIAAFQHKQEQLRRQEQAAADEKARKERERLEKRAEAAREKGQEEKAAALEEKAFTTVAAAPATPEVSVTGVSMRKVWKAEVTDVKQLCALIASGEIPPSVIEFKQAELNRLASTWQNSKQFPGLRIFQDSSVASSRR